MNRQPPMEWEKIPVNYLSDKGLISKKHIWNSQQEKNKKKILIKIWAEVLNRYFFKTYKQSSRT